MQNQAQGFWIALADQGGCMTQDELATLAQILKDHGFTHEEARAAMTDLYEGRLPEPTRGWISRLLANLRGGKYAETETPEVKRWAAEILGGAALAPAADEGDQRVYPMPESESSGPMIISKRPLLRAAIADIEVTDFNSEGFGGYLICVCILPMDADKPQTLTIQHNEFGDDRRLLIDVCAALSEFDIISGHNWSAFDQNWVNSKLMFHRLPPLRTHWILDTYQVTRAMGLKTRKSLGNLIDYFGLEGEKTTIYRKSWNDIRHPDIEVFQKTLASVVYHCEQDTIANRNLLEVLLPYALTMQVNPFKLSKMRNMNFTQVRGIAA
jgi:hypothetical protein